MATTAEVWFGLETGNPGDGTLNGTAPSGSALMDVARATNHAAVQGRCILSTAFYSLGSSPSANGTTDVWHFAVDLRNHNGLEWWCAAVLAPKDNTLNANMAALQLRETVGAVTLAVDSHSSRSAAITWPADLIHRTAHVAVVPDDAVDNLIVRVVDGYRLMALSIWEAPAATWPGSPALLPTVPPPAAAMHYVEDAAFRPGNLIVSDNTPASALRALSATQEEIFHRVRSVYNPPQIQSLPRQVAVVGAAAALNIYDGSATASPGRGPQEAGIPVDTHTGGYGYRTQVEATCRVNAKCTAGTGYVEFRSSIGAGAVTVGPIGAQGWYTGAAKLPLAVGANIDGLGRTWDLVAMYAYVNPGPVATVEVWTPCVDINPD